MIRKGVNFYRLLSSALLLALVFTGLMLPAGARAAPQSAAIRLLEGGRDGATYLAALEIVLEPGYVTYWRTPGDAGIAPVFDWSGSKNVASVAVAWPAPKRVLEADSIVYAFDGKVLLPLRITPEKTGDPVEVKLNLQYGVCKNICIPAESAASLSLKGVGKDALTVQQAFDNLPEKVALGDPAAPFAVQSVKSDTGQDGLTVTLRVPGGEKAELFTEGPDDKWIFSTSESQPGQTPGTAEFKVKREAAPANSTGLPTIRLTARAGTRAIETEFAPHRK